MTEIVPPSMADAVKRLQSAMLQLPQFDLSAATTHYFADGMYCRMLARPAGCLIVGKAHRREHFYMIIQGRVRVTTDDGVKDIQAPAVIVSSPGTKRAVLALEDSICLTVHRTDSTDLDEIEAQLIEPDDTALFDSHNQPRSLPCPG